MRTRTMKARMLSLALSLLMMVILLGNSLLAYAGAEGLSDVRAESIEKATSSDARREEVSSVEIEEDANTLREEIIEDIVTATDSEADKMDVIDGEVLELPETLAFRTRAAIPNNDMDLDADSLYYAKDKGEYLSVVDAETKEVVEEWAFCIQSNYGTPSYYGGDSHIGEYKLLEEYDADALYQELREASPKADSETCFVRIRNAMYLFASDPTKIQERYSLPRFTFYTLTQDEIYGWSNGQRKTKYGVQNWNDARSEIETLILKDDLIPSNVAVEMRIYDAQRRIGHSVQSLATLRIAEEIVPELPEDKASLRTSVSIDGRSASDKEALQEEAGSNKTVVDTISYKGLVPGKEYTLTGSLMKIEGEHAVQVGKSVSKRFTPAKEEGTESISFTNVTLEAGVTYVVYEEAESTEELTFATGTKKHRIEHKDKDDKA
ncbi:MAG: thioester-forming surface-anchored protein [Clostridiaceae bacterium]|nr:thioester-forming surface-anchored protein [Clostridium sp.]MCI6140613.1 thioester-forming surface-anchored protein [Clostridium sp.]MDY3231544.1 thioester-forming surface-anchored protein [Clostridiaceae bacterium]